MKKIKTTNVWECYESGKFNEGNAKCHTQDFTGCIRRVGLHRERRRPYGVNVSTPARLQALRSVLWSYFSPGLIMGCSFRLLPGLLPQDKGVFRCSVLFWMSSWTLTAGPKMKSLESQSWIRSFRMAWHSLVKGTTRTRSNCMVLCLHWFLRSSN